MIRRIIEIDEARCTGCGLCAEACREGAIRMVDGKARLMRDDFCDGLGNCLPACPADAIRFVEREAAAFDEGAVREAKSVAVAEAAKATETAEAAEVGAASELRHWPVQLQLAPVRAPWFDGCDLLIAADCTAYARAGFHREFMRGRAVVVGCPKLDAADYAAKLAQILSANDVRSVTLTRMVVPCCGGLARAAQQALAISGRRIPLRIVTISTDGSIVE